MRRDLHRHYRRVVRRCRRGRHADCPVLLLGSGEPLGLLALAAVGRWAYRHRSAFLPVTIAAAAFAVAAPAHPHHGGAWITVTMVTAVLTFVLAIPHRIVWAHPSARITTGILARAWEACGIDRPVERTYATAVIAVTGGWLAAAIAVGPTARPLPAVAAVATVVLGVPWWAHRRRRARASRTIQAWRNSPRTWACQARASRPSSRIHGAGPAGLSCGKAPPRPRP